MLRVSSHPEEPAPAGDVPGLSGSAAGIHVCCQLAFSLGFFFFLFYFNRSSAFRVFESVQIEVTQVFKIVDVVYLNWSVTEGAFGGPVVTGWQGSHWERI